MQQIFMRKGQGPEVIAIVFLLIGVYTLGSQIVAYQTAQDLKVNKMEDFTTIVQTRSAAEYFAQNYVNQSLLYSSWQESYRLARQGGGFSLWPERNLKNTITYASVQDNLEDAMQDSPYFQNFAGPQCTLRFRDPYSFQITNTYNRSFAFHGDKNDLEMVCQQKQITTKYYINATHRMNSSGNRFFQAFNTSHNYTATLDEKLDTMKDPSNSFYAPGPGTDKSTAEGIAKGIAKFIAETSYRTSMIDHMDTVRSKTSIPSQMQLSIENRPAIAIADIPAIVANTALPDIISDLNSLKTELRTKIQALRAEIQSVITDTEIASDKIRKKLENTVDTDTIRTTLDGVQQDIDQVFSQADFSTEVSQFKTDLKNHIEQVNTENDELKKKLRRFSSRQAADTKQQVTQSLMQRIDLKQTVITESELQTESARAATETLQFQDEAVNWSTIRSTVVNSNFSTILNRTKQNIKEEVRREVEVHFSQTVEQEVLEFIRDYNLTYNLSQQLKQANLTDEITQQLQNNITEPAANKLSTFIAEQVNATINRTVEVVQQKVEKAVTDAFQSTDISVSDDAVIQKAMEQMDLEGTIKEKTSKIGDYLAERVKQELQQRTNAALKDVQEQAVERIDEELQSELDQITNIADRIAVETELSVTGVAKELLNTSEQLAADFAAQQVDRWFKPLEKHFSDDFVTAQQFKENVLNAINASLQAKAAIEQASLSSYNDTVLQQQNSGDLTEKQVADAIADGVEQVVDQHVQQYIQNVFVDTAMVPDNMQQQFKQKVDSQVNVFQVVDRFAQEKDKIQQQVDGYFGEIDRILDKVDTALQNVDRLVELQEQLEQYVDQIDRQLQNIIDTLDAASATGNAFEYDFIDVSIEGTVGPLPFCGECFVSLASVKLDPASVEPHIAVQDNNFSLPVSAGYKNLTFNFTYHHTFEGDKNMQCPKNSKCK